MNQSINSDSKNIKEPQQKYRLGTVSIKILGGLNRFYRRLTSPSASIMAQNIQLFGPRALLHAYLLESESSSSLLMLWTFLQSFSFITYIASKDFFFFFWLPYNQLPYNQSNQEIWTKSICLVEDHSTNISKKYVRQNICNEIAINANCHFSYL